MTEPKSRLRVGFVGSGFIAHFHLRSMIGVRNVDITGVWSPTEAKREAFAEEVRALGLGDCNTYPDLTAMLASGTVDALWIVSPNDTRVDVMRSVAAARAANTTSVYAVACEKPLARTLTEAREMQRLADPAGLATGYLENQVFAPAVRRGHEIIWRRAAAIAGRPYLARAAEEHSGPHEPWFWQGKRQGGGVLSDMMCHSVEVARFLLTEPGAPRSSLALKSASATVRTLKWSRPNYADRLRTSMKGVDFTNHPVEDFARGTLILEDAQGQEAVIEATTSWAFVGAGLRINLELLGPEYAMEYSTLASPLKVFISREVTGGEGEDLVEKQNAEQGQMPVLEDEEGTYGYTAENRHFVECFRTGTTPELTFEDGVAVVEMLMALYKSAETDQVVKFPDPDLETYVPVPAR